MVHGLQWKSNASKLRRIQRLPNFKIAKAYRTTSHEALCELSGIAPVIVELENTEKLYHITCRKNQDGLYDAPMNYRRWPHPANGIELKNKRDDIYCKFDIYTDGINPLAYTDGCQTAGLSRSIFTQPAVRRSEPSMSFLLILAFCQ